MKKLIKINITLILILLLGVTDSFAQLTHPGGWLTQTDLNRIREGVASGQEPWARAWDDIRNSGARKNTKASVSRIITNDGAFQAQGEDAFRLAIKWVVTGDREYATAGINIINAWANTVEGFDIKNTPLREGIGSNMMANAAEILAHGFNGAAGWSSGDLRRAQDWFENVIYPITSTGRSRSMNWGTSCLAGNMSMAIFVDNMTMFNDAIDAYKFGFTNTNDGCAGVAQYIANEEGQCFESGRDQSHTMGGIAHLVEPAMIAWNQGVNLVTYKKNRLVVGMEYTAKFNLGNDVPFTKNIPNPCNIKFNWLNNNFISQDDRGDYSPVFVMANTLFEYAGIDHPFTNQVASLPSYFPEYTNSDHPGMGHLLYSGATSNNPPPPSSNGTLVHITKRNATGFAIDGGNGGSNGQNVTLSKVNTSDEGQLWVEIDRGNGFYSYEKFGTNFSLDGNNGGATRQNVYIWTTSATNQNQQWRKEPQGDGGFKLIKRNANGFAINGGSGGAEGRSINMWNSASTNQNLQWFVTPVATDIRLEAEGFDRMSGIQTEASTESGDNVGYINNGDWLRFDDINLSGITNMDARVATKKAGGTLEIRTGSATGTLIGSMKIGNTGGFQNWRTLSTGIKNANGTQDVYLVFRGGSGFLFNVNWVEFNTKSLSNKNDLLIATQEVKLYPNPVSEITTIQNAANSIITIYDIKGSEVLTQSIYNDTETINLNGLKTGIYYAKIYNETTNSLLKILKN